MLTKGGDRYGRDAMDKRDKDSDSSNSMSMVLHSDRDDVGPMGGKNKGLSVP